MLENLKRQNIALFLNGDTEEKVPTMRSTNEKLEQTIVNIRNHEDSPRMKFGGTKYRSCKKKKKKKEEGSSYVRKKKEFG